MPVEEAVLGPSDVVFDEIEVSNDFGFGQGIHAVDETRAGLVDRVGDVVIGRIGVGSLFIKITLDSYVEGVGIARAVIVEARSDEGGDEIWVVFDKDHGDAIEMQLQLARSVFLKGSVELLAEAGDDVFGQG